MTAEQLLPIITVWFDNQRGEWFEGSDPKDASIDGRFNLEDLARTIAAHYDIKSSMESNLRSVPLDKEAAAGYLWNSDAS